MAGNLHEAASVVRGSPSPGPAGGREGAPEPRHHGLCWRRTRGHSGEGPCMGNTTLSGNALRPHRTTRPACRGAWPAGVKARARRWGDTLLGVGGGMLAVPGRRGSPGRVGTDHPGGRHEAEFPHAGSSLVRPESRPRPAIPLTAPPQPVAPQTLYQARTTCPVSPASKSRDGAALVTCPTLDGSRADGGTGESREPDVGGRSGAGGQNRTPCRVLTRPRVPPVDDKAGRRLRP